jgi:hypothetical protein
MSAALFFLPGRPQIWMGMTAVAIGVSVLQYAINREYRFVSVPSINRPLFFLGLVVLLTARLTGGIGVAALGGGVYGGKRYVMILGAIIGYFAITSRRIPPEKAKLYVSLFFLGSITMALGSLAGVISPAFNFIFLIFPVESLAALTGDTMAPTSVVGRIGGLPFMSMGIFCAMLAQFGLKGLFNIRKPWRLIGLILCIFLGMFGGFRSVLIQFLLVFLILFFMEGLVYTRALPAVIAMAILGGALIAATATKLPLSVQRTLAFLPIDIDPIARMDAQTSTEWRIKMWQDVLPEIPKYLIVGKGYVINPNELAMVRLEAARNPVAGAELAGDYHNGPLSIIVPLGLFGVAAFLWFIVAALRVVWFNYKYGDPFLLNLNRFIFAYFLMRTVFFFTIFGSLYSDLMVFTGLLGLSISLNGGVAKPVTVPVAEPQPAFTRLRLHPAARKPINA